MRETVGFPNIAIMTRLLPAILMALFLSAVSSQAAEQRVIKVLPHFMDQEGRHANTPSLFERDAYQAWLRTNPEEQSGIRYDIQWQSFISGEYVMRLLIEKALAGILVVLFSATVITVIWQVIGRYVLAAPSSATN